MFDEQNCRQLQKSVPAEKQQVSNVASLSKLHKRANLVSQQVQLCMTSTHSIQVVPAAFDCGLVGGMRHNHGLFIPRGLGPHRLINSPLY
jgi:hypothetical protein